LLERPFEWKYCFRVIGYHCLKGHTHAIIVLEELSNGYLASSALDKTIVIWNLENGEIFNTLEGFE